MRKCSININDKDYVIQVNRDSIVWLEARGFSVEEFARKPITYIDMIWTSGFLVNHSDVNQSLALKLMETYKEEALDLPKLEPFEGTNNILVFDGNLYPSKTNIVLKK